MTDLERFEQWAKSRGHYPVLEALKRFRDFEANMKALEGDVLRERVKDD